MEDSHLAIPDARLRSGLAFFLPDCLYIDVARSREQLAALKLEELKAALQAAASKATRGEIFSAAPAAPKHFVAEMAHEHDHLRRYVGTSFGLLTHYLHCKTLEQLPPAFDELARSGADGLPLLVRSKRAGLRGEALSENLSVTAMLAGLQDLYLALDRSVPLEHFRLGEEVLRRELDLAGLKLRPLRESCRRYRTDQTSPTFDFRGDSKRFTARTLLEFFAVGAQGNALLNLGDELHPVAELISDGSLDYSFIHVLWDRQFPLEHLPLPGQQDRESDQPSVDYYRMYQFELFTLLDLALWVPFGPEGFVAGDGTLGWEDINPAFRFLRAMDVLRGWRVEGTTIPGNEASRNHLFGDLQERVCAVLDWPTPQLLARSWLKALQRPERWKRPRFFLDALSRYRREATTKLLQFRLEQPADVVLNFVDFNAAGVARAPGWIFLSEENRSGCCEAESQLDVAQYLDTVLAFQLSRVARALLYGSGAGDSILRFSPAYRAEALRSFLALYDDSEGTERERLIEDASVALGLSTSGF